ncbi:bifunctional UDP-N-acetylglucosamine diphosphorylase/glucosamine-1-phosphate N-acetyltransferase GlmU [uncultured Helcococcus sp.]|uniref:bifunctional UDP-N-acetylglucosamine diphosphorylase/glucosamine-1-phosphate N-acetyltransferase GlmU n=1 Tax=uncultured Helcococcus sp. TaxID=1072508 RepID=UPI00260CF94C|nr:bifunctional UDP-N-acetylglucosamine diphosphorylase/glucosamine-1-phosphate N-acetyltransferase GlmU [uncultured Helcococcus sp.]
MNKVIILAAGEGTRMKSNISKVLHKLCNRPILSYMIDASIESKVDEVIVIVGNNEDQVKEAFGDKVKYVRQEIGEGIPYGTGYAVKLAEDFIGDNDNILVLTGDVPLISKETIVGLMDKHNKENNLATVLTADFEDPSGYGRIVKNENGQFQKIVEHKDCSPEELEVKEINSGIQVFNGEKLKYALNKLDTNNSQGELYLTDVFDILQEEKGKIDTYKLSDNEEIMGINDKIQLAQVEKVMRRRINESYMRDGVILENPETITIEKGVKIGRDTIIEQNTKILGNTEIGENCLIGMNTRINDAKIGNNVTIFSSFIDQAVVGDGSDLGPFARLRPKAELKENVHVGNFVEVKNAVLDDGVKAGHLAYIGDADVGKRVNVSCGVIFSNYDGKNKFRSTIGDDAFLGANVNIVSPINIADKGFLAAGSTITKDVAEGELAVERSEQKNIKGYYTRKFGE